MIQYEFWGRKSGWSLYVTWFIHDRAAYHDLGRLELQWYLCVPFGCDMGSYFLFNRRSILVQSSITSREEIYRQATNATFLGIFINLALGAIKLTAGLIANSFALLSDAFNSIGDVFASCVVLFSLKVSQKPPDQEHPYGHSRAETIGAFVVSQVIILSAVLIGWEAIKRFSVHHPLPPTWTLWVAGGNVIIKEALYRYKLHMSHKTGSSALLANAWDHRSDALCSFAVLVGLAIITIGGDRFIFADELAAIVVVVLIIYNAIQILLNSIQEMMDMQEEPEFVMSVKKLAESHELVDNIEKIKVRKSGLEHFVDIHVQVNPEMSIKTAHRVGHEVKDIIMNNFPSICDVLVHMEPTSE